MRWSPRFQTRMVAMVAAAVLLVAACGSTTTPTANNGVAQPSWSPPPIGATSGGDCGTTNENYFWVSAISTLPLFVANDHPTLFKTAHELGVCAHIVGPSAMDLPGDVAAIEQVCAGHPDGVMVVGLDSSLASAINKCITEKVPTVTIDVDVANSNRLSFIGGNFVSLGTFIADEMIKVEQKKGNSSGQIADTDLITNPSNTQIYQGIKDELTAKGYTLVARSNDMDTAEGGATAAHDLISAYPNLIGIISLGSEPGPGVVQAVKEAGKTGTVLVCAGEHDIAFAQQVQSGGLACFFGPKRVNITQFGLIALYQFNHAPNLVEGIDKWVSPPIAPFIDVGAYAVDSDTISSYLSANPASSPSASSTPGAAASPSASQ
jgi:ABC-type sugar transport system substrate-binding protein